VGDRGADNRRQAASDSHSARPGPFLRNVRRSIRTYLADHHPHGTATRRWPVKCRHGHRGVQTRGGRAADHGTERHARLRPLSRSVGTADGVPVTGRCRLLVSCAVSRGASWPGQRTSRTLPGVCNLTARPRGRPPCRKTHPTWAAKSAARCLSSGAQPSHTNCGVWQSN
jgi:hypothetical protein